MAEQQQQEKCPGGRNENDGQTTDEMEVDENLREIKRKRGDSPSSEVPPKSPRLESTSIEENTDLEVLHTVEDTAAQTKKDPTLSPRSKSKNWRRSTRSRRSLSANPFAVQNLCKSISLSLSEEERAERLMEAAMNVAVERLEKTLVTLPDADLEVFQKQVASLKEDWTRVAKEIREETNTEQEKDQSTKTDPKFQRTVEMYTKAMKRLETESALWDALLEKHQLKAEKLTEIIEEKERLPLDPNCVAQSSQSALIARKPDYNNILSRQQKHLSTVQLLLDCQNNLFKQLLSSHEQCKQLMKEISAKLAHQAGFDDDTCPVRKLLKDPCLAHHVNLDSNV